jgi:predicted nucleic acid-binding protein
VAAIIIAAANPLIADASPLIALARVIGLGWLEALFGQVLVTEEVMAEVLSGGYPAREEPIDERAGRAVAEAFGIRLARTAAVIGLARQWRLIESARAVFAELHANDFRIAPSASPPP